MKLKFFVVCIFFFLVAGTMNAAPESPGKYSVDAYGRNLIPDSISEPRAPKTIQEMRFDALRWLVYLSTAGVVIFVGIFIANAIKKKK